MQAQGKRRAGTKRVYSLANPASVALGLARSRSSELAAAGAVLQGLMRNPVSFKKKAGPENGAAPGQAETNSKGAFLAAPACAAAGGAHAAAGMGAGAGAAATIAAAGPAGRQWWQKQAPGLPAPAPAARAITTATAVAGAQPSAPAGGVMGVPSLPGTAPSTSVSSAPQHHHQQQQQQQQHAARNAVIATALWAAPAALQVPMGAAGNLWQVQLAQQQQFPGALHMQATALHQQVVAAQLQAALRMRVAALAQQA